MPLVALCFKQWNSGISNIIELVTAGKYHQSSQMTMTFLALVDLGDMEKKCKLGTN